MKATFNHSCPRAFGIQSKARVWLLNALLLASMVLILNLGRAHFAAPSNQIPPASTAQLWLTPEPTVLQTHLPQIGMNLGASSTWGAEQLMANVLHNPGFEAPIDRSLLIVAAIEGNAVQDDTAWLARAPGFWRAARYNVRSGSAAGSSGRVLESYQKDAPSPSNSSKEQTAAWYILENLPATVAIGDAIVLTQEASMSGVPLWWQGHGKISGISGQTRPGSAGQQSLQLLADELQGAQLHHYLDMLGERAGILLPIIGQWRLRFWAKGLSSKQGLQLRFARSNATPFLSQSIALSEQWQEYSFTFSGDEKSSSQGITSKAGNLALSFEISAGALLLDDVELAPIAATTDFRPEVLAVLQQLRPGYLRDWQGQLGDTLSNRLAPPAARRPVRYRPGEAELKYFYSLPEFLALCAKVGAQPWIVAPPLMDDQEWQQLGKFLQQAKAQYGFREIVLEFGNENWNALFRPAGFNLIDSHAQAAERAFHQLTIGSNNLANIITVVNAQFVNPASWGHLASRMPRAQRIAVAPYFMYQVPAQISSLEENIAATFAENQDVLRLGIGEAAKYGKQVAAYEVNFHTTEGPRLANNATNANNATDLSRRNALVTDAHSGPALARRLLQASLLGVREQAVYSLAGFDSYTSSRQLVRLWGVSRDLTGSPLRPTGLAISLLNQALAKAHETDQTRAYASQCKEEAFFAASCQHVTALWLQSESNALPRQTELTRLAVVSASKQAIQIQTKLPCSRQFRLTLLDASQAGLNNEEPSAPKVKLEDVALSCRTNWQFQLPAFSLAVLSEIATPAKKRGPL